MKKGLELNLPEDKEIPGPRNKNKQIMFSE